jgi:hypothetical protein
VTKKVVGVFVRFRAPLHVIHEFEYIPHEEIWFPIRKTFKIVKGKMTMI